MPNYYQHPYITVSSSDSNYSCYHCTPVIDNSDYTSDVPEKKHKPIIIYLTAKITLKIEKEEDEE